MSCKITIFSNSAGQDQDQCRLPWAGSGTPPRTEVEGKSCMHACIIGWHTYSMQDFGKGRGHIRPINGKGPEQLWGQR